MPAPALRGRTALLALAGLLAVAAPAAPASAARSCGEAVLRDWADGTIDRTHPRRCYRDALDSMPEDLRIYSSAEDDIRRALLNAETASGARAPRAQPRRTLAAHERRRAAAAERAAGGGDGLPLPLPLLAAVAVAALWGAAGLTSAGIALARRRASGRGRAG
jgi:hypothetical protein